MSLGTTKRWLVLPPGTSCREVQELAHAALAMQAGNRLVGFVCDSVVVSPSLVGLYPGQFTGQVLHAIEEKQPDRRAVRTPAPKGDLSATQCGLEGLELEDVLSVLPLHNPTLEKGQLRECIRDGVLPLWKYIMHELSPHTSAAQLCQEGQAVQFTLERLYNICSGTTPDAGTAPTDMFAAGLALLCQGTAEEKVAKALSIFDNDDDGAVDRQECHRFLVCLFLVIYEFSGESVAHSSGNVIDMAEDITQDVFLDAEYACYNPVC